MALTAAQSKTIVKSDIAAALAFQKQSFERQLQDVSKRTQKLAVETPVVETYTDAEKNRFVY